MYSCIYACVYAQAILAQDLCLRFMHSSHRGPLTASIAMSSPPSLWSTREQRRHAAVARDMNAIAEKFNTLESMVFNLDAKLDEVLIGIADLNAGKSHAEASRPDPSVQDVSARVARMEFLLMRTSVNDLRPSMPKSQPCYLKR